MKGLRSVLAAGLVLCLAAAPGLSADIVVGMSAAFRGPSRALGIELFRGSRAYLDEVNRTGGVHGRKVVLRPYDDGYNPLPALRNTMTLVDGDDIFLLYGYVGTPTVTRVLPLLRMYEDRPIYLLFPFTGALPQRRPPYERYVFNLRASYHEETEGLVDQFVALGLRKVGVFYQMDAYGRSGWEGVRNALRKHGLQMVSETTYRRGVEYSADLSEQVEILRKAGSDVVISVGSYAACAAFIRDARNAGWDAPIANLSFVGSESLLKLLKQEAEETSRDYTSNLVVSQVVPSYKTTSLPAVEEYRQAMTHLGSVLPDDYNDGSYNPQILSSVSFEGYLNAKLLVEILERVGDPPLRSAIGPAVESIQNLDLGIGAPISFGPNRHQGLDMVYYITVTGGEFVPVEDWQTLVQ